MNKKLTREVIENAFMCTIDSEADTSRYVSREKFIRYLENNGYLEEPLTFEKIRKECVSGETTLVNAQGYELIYIGFYSQKVVLGNAGSIHKVKEEGIVNWSIKK